MLFSGLINMYSENINKIWKITPSPMKIGNSLSLPFNLRMLTKHYQVNMT